MISLSAFFRLYKKGYLYRDVRNILTYGYTAAPKACEQIWINPTQVTERVITPFERQQSASVLGGDWDLQKRRFVKDLPKIKMCREHFIEGVSWEETGAYAYAKKRIRRDGKYDGCMNIDHVIQRYQDLDQIYQDLKGGKPFLSQSELCNNNIRERGGIHIHIGRNQELLFSGGGHHRLAIAQLLNLEEIPVQLGVIHQEAMSKSLMPSLRRSRQP